MALGGPSGESRVPAMKGWSRDLDISLATNDLIQGMQLCWVAKSPLMPVTSHEDLVTWLCTRLVVEAVRLRLQTRWCTGSSPCNFHCYDSIREGVSVTTLTVMSEPLRWASTAQDVLQEVRAVARLGIDSEELDLIMRMTMSKIEETAKAQPWSYMGTLSGYDAASTSRDIVEALIASAPAGHLLTKADAFNQTLQKARGQIDLGRVNEACVHLLGHFGGVGEPCGRVVVSSPAFMLDEVTGRRVPIGLPDAAEVSTALRSITELTEEEVRSKRVTVPLALLPEAGPVALAQREELPGGVVKLTLQNGMRIRLLVHPSTPDGPSQSTMRLHAPGGRAADILQGIDGAVQAGLMALESSGVSSWSREQVQLYKRLHSVSADFRALPNAIETDIHFAPSVGSCRAALEWLRCMLESPQFDLQGFVEAQLRLKGAANAREKTMEGKAIQMLKQDMYPRDPWLWDATLDQVNRLTLGQARRAAQAQLGNLGAIELDVASSALPSMSLSRVGSSMSHEEEAGGISPPVDEDGSQQAMADMRQMLEEEICRTLGSLRAPAGAPAAPDVGAMQSTAAWSGTEQRVHLPDADERAFVVIAGGAPGFWGPGDSTWDVATKLERSNWDAKCAADPLYASTAMQLMSEAMNMRLLGRIRDQLSLSYSCEVTITMYDGFPGGHWICKLYAAPEKISTATCAALDVIRSPGRFPFVDQEIDASRRVMAYREGQAKQQKGYWADKLRPLPNGQVGAERIAHERHLMETLTADDAMLAWRTLNGVEDPFVVQATSGSPMVAQMMPRGRMVERDPRPQPSSPASSASSAGSNMDFLD